MKKVDELMQELSTKKDEVRSLLNENKVDDAEAKMAEVRSLEKKIELQKQLDEEEERKVDEKMEKTTVEVRKENKVDVEYRAIAKHLMGKELTTEERASINVGNSGAIMPEGFVNQLQVLTKGFPSLKRYTHVIPVTTNTGKMPASTGSATRKLAKLAVDTEMVKEMVTTAPVEFAVEDFGKIYPVENPVLEDAGIELFNGIIAPDVAECSVNSENAEIIKIVKDNAVAGATGADHKAIIKTLNTMVVPSLKGRTVILTNQDGYDYLDGLTDSQGRPLLSDSLAVEGGKVFKGREVVVLDNADLEPTTAGKKPFYIVNLYALVKFFDRKQYEIAVSKEVGFTYNQTFLRVVERFDAVKGDNRANYYIEL
ncbi:phage major capsid protein [Brevibacillus centrosporus]|uniref:phage major capsid protein n=1 Tax=Brevibacillus centrosporus TaxID=54910 RepID=UPI002E1F75A2|nr:phage major capsid protein [Brevibacillus centrosporus]MED1953791.1 phage major capsid protein [Brevibacillus centrosporus]